MDKPRGSLHRLALLALLLALALILGWVESLIPLPILVPGFKLGLGNAAVLFALYAQGRRDAFVLLIMKVMLSSILFSGFSAFLYALAGGLLSYLVMALLVRREKSSVPFVSMTGAVCHNIGQVAAAALLLGTPHLVYVLALLLLCGLVTGSLTGLAASLILKRLNFGHFDV